MGPITKSISTHYQPQQWLPNYKRTSSSLGTIPTIPRQATRSPSSTPAGCMIHPRPTMATRANNSTKCHPHLRRPSQGYQRQEDLIGVVDKSFGHCVGESYIDHAMRLTLVALTCSFSLSHHRIGQKHVGWRRICF